MGLQPSETQVLFANEIAQKCFPNYKSIGYNIRWQFWPKRILANVSRSTVRAGGFLRASRLKKARGVKLRCPVRYRGCAKTTLLQIAPPLAATVGTVRQPHAMMATPAEERLWEEIRETKEEKKEVKAELKNAVGAEKERLQERLIKLDGQLEGYATAIGKLPAAPGIRHDASGVHIWTQL